MLRYRVMAYLIRAITSLTCIYIFLTLQPAYSVEKYERKSISIMSNLLLAPTAEDIPKDRQEMLLSAIQSQIKMARFDYNMMPESREMEFWKRAGMHLSNTLRDLGTVTRALKEIDRQIGIAERSIESVSKLIKLAKPSAEQDANKPSDQESSEDSKKKDELENKRKDLLSQKSELLKKQVALEEALFQQASQLINETVAPAIAEILSDPDVQMMRAKQYVDETERQSFIVSKAKEMGIDGEDLEKVMNSAYICLFVLTDYDHVHFVDETTNKKLLNYTLSGCILWYKVAISKDDGVTRIEPVKLVKASSSVSGNLETGTVSVNLIRADIENLIESTKFHIVSSLDQMKGDSSSKSRSKTSSKPDLDPETLIFKSAVNDLLGKLSIETLKIPDFMLKTGIVDVKGSRIGISMTAQDGLHVDQKFRIYEKVKIGEKIEEKKLGYFYVAKVADGSSGNTNISYGKVVIGKAEPGLQIKEYPTKGFNFNLSFAQAKIGMERGILELLSHSLVTEKEEGKSLKAIGLTSDYNIGRKVNISQLFTTIGANIGLASFDNVKVEPYSGKPSAIYLSAHIGLIRKFYIKRSALLIKSTVQLQNLSFSYKKDKNNSVSFDNTRYSLNFGIGLEPAISENLSIGFSLDRTIALGEANKWRGSYKSRYRTSREPTDGYTVGPAVKYPKKFFSIYVNVGF